jgi:hypothetical protein
MIVGKQKTYSPEILERTKGIINELSDLINANPIVIRSPKLKIFLTFLLEELNTMQGFEMDISLMDALWKSLQRKMVELGIPDVKMNEWVVPSNTSGTNDDADAVAQAFGISKNNGDFIALIENTILKVESVMSVLMNALIGGSKDELERKSAGPMERKVKKFFDDLAKEGVICNGNRCNNTEQFVCAILSLFQDFFGDGINLKEKPIHVKKLGQDLHLALNSGDHEHYRSKKILERDIDDFGDYSSSLIPKKIIPIDQLRIPIPSKMRLNMFPVVVDWFNQILISKFGKNNVEIQDLKNQFLIHTNSALNKEDIDQSLTFSRVQGNLKYNINSDWYLISNLNGNDYGLTFTSISTLLNRQFQAILLVDDSILEGGRIKTSLSESKTPLQLIKKTQYLLPVSLMGVVNSDDHSATDDETESEERKRDSDDDETDSDDDETESKETLNMSSASSIKSDWESNPTYINYGTYQYKKEKDRKPNEIRSETEVTAVYKVSYITASQSSDYFIFDMRCQVDACMDLARRVKDLFLQSSGLLALLKPRVAYEEFDGSRGTLAMDKSINASLSNGSKMAVQKFKKRIEEEKCYLYTVIDISGSMDSFIGSVMLLVLTLFAVFDNRFHRGILGLIMDKLTWSFGKLGDGKENDMDEFLTSKYRSDRENLERAILNADKIIAEANTELSNLTRKINAASSDFEKKVYGDSLRYWQDKMAEAKLNKPKMETIKNYQHGNHSSFPTEETNEIVEGMEMEKSTGLTIQSEKFAKLPQSEKYTKKELEDHKKLYGKLVKVKTQPRNQLTEGRMLMEFNALRKLYIQLFNLHSGGGTNSHVIEDIVTHKYTRNKGLKYFIVITDMDLGDGERSYNSKWKRYDNIGGEYGVLKWLEVLSSRKDSRSLLVCTGSINREFSKVGETLNLPFSLTNLHSTELTRYMATMFETSAYYVLKASGYFEKMAQIEKRYKDKTTTYYQYQTELYELDIRHGTDLWHYDYFKWMTRNVANVIYTDSGKMTKPGEIRRILGHLKEQKFFIK